MAAKKSPPTMKSQYGGEPPWYWENHGKAEKIPTRQKVRRDKAVPRKVGMTVAELTKLVDEFATANGVKPSDVKLDMDTGWRSNVYLWVDVLQSDAEYDRAVKRAEAHNRAYARYKADLHAVREWQKTGAKEAEAKERKHQDAAKAAAHAELVREAKEDLRNNARAMKAVANEVLNDEEFVKSLKKLFTS